MEKIFEVNKLIGKGTFGRVFKVTDTLGQTFAVKKVSKRILDNKSSEYLKKEISILSEISHPNITNCLFSFENDSSVFIIQEYCSGGDLETYLRKNKSVKKSIMRKWITGLLNGLTYLHRNNIMHRDLKLANLLLSTADSNTAELKLADFGFAKKMELKITGTLLGSPLYMAPEIFREENYSIKADIWSLGLVLFEIFTGQGLYSCSSLDELIRKQEDPVTFSEISRLPLVYKSLMLSLLQKNPESRPSCEEIWNSDYFAEWFIENEEYFEQNEGNYEFLDVDSEPVAGNEAEPEVDLEKSEYFDDFEENNFSLVTAEIEIAVLEDLISARQELVEQEEAERISLFLNRMENRVMWHKEKILKEMGKLLDYDPAIQRGLDRIDNVLAQLRGTQVYTNHNTTIHSGELTGFRKYTLGIVNES